MRALDESRRPRVELLRWGLAGLVAVVTFVLGAVLALNRDIPGITGDEPHYLLIAQSIALDGDVDLANDYASPERVAAAYPGFTEVDPVTHAGVYREGGPTVPIHAIGLPLLLSPAYLLGGGYVAARFIAIALTALTAGAMFLVVHRLVRRPVIAVVATLSVMLVVPSVAFSQQLYPEIPAGALLAASLAVLTGGRPTTRRLVVASALGALIPWMHLRFALLVVALAAAVLVVALGLPRAGGVRALRQAVREHWRRALLAMTPMVVSAAGILAYHQVMYGSMSPNAAYRPDVFPGELPFQPYFVWVYGLGSVIDEQRGVLPYAPVLLVAAAATVVAWLRWRWWAVLPVVACTVYLVLASGIAQGGGYCPPGRWLVVFVPLLAVPLAAALDHSRHAWWLVAPTLLFSLAVTAQLVAHYQDLYPAAGDRQVLPVASAVAEVWPDVMERRSAGFVVQAGRLQLGPAGEPLGDDDVVSLPGAVGTVVSGPDAIMVPSVYEARFRVRLDGEPGRVLGLAQVLVGDDVTHELPLVVPEHGADEWHDVAVQVAASAAPTETRVVSFGTDGTIAVDRTAMMWQEPGLPSLRSQLHDVPRATLWAGLALLVAVLLVAPRRRAAGAAAASAPAGGPAPGDPAVAADGTSPGPAATEPTVDPDTPARGEAPTAVGTGAER